MTKLQVTLIILGIAVFATVVWMGWGIVAAPVGLETLTVNGQLATWYGWSLENLLNRF